MAEHTPSEAFEPSQVFDFAHPFPQPDGEERFAILAEMLKLEVAAMTTAQRARLIAEFEDAPSITEFNEWIDTRKQDKTLPRVSAAKRWPEPEAVYAREVIVPGLARAELLEPARILADGLPCKGHRFEAQRRILAITRLAVDAERLLDTANEQVDYGEGLSRGWHWCYWPDLVLDTLEHGSHVVVARQALEQDDIRGVHRSLLWLAIHEHSQNPEDLEKAYLELKESPEKRITFRTPNPAAGLWSG